MKSLILVLSTIFFISCGSSIPNDVKWEITKEEPNEAISKNNLEIKLNKKVDESVLKEIALEIREDRTKYDKLWIFYYIPNYKNGSAWATTHFTPNLEINIMGSSEIQDQKTTKTDNINGEILGKWRSEASLMGATLVLYKKDTTNKLMMQINFKDGGVIDSEIKKSEINGITKYEDDNTHGEYYILESNGNLGLYGKDGKFDEAIKL